MITCPACGSENIDGAEECEFCEQSLTHLSRPRARSAFEKILHREPVRSLRSHKPVIVTSDRKIKDVIASLVLHKEGCAVVADADGAVRGIFSERDLLLKVALNAPELLDRPVGEFMTPDPVVVQADWPIAYALHQMDLGGYRHLPVVENNRPVGLVSVRDIITFIGDRVAGSS